MNLKVIFQKDSYSCFLKTKWANDIQFHEEVDSMLCQLPVASVSGVSWHPQPYLQFSVSTNLHPTRNHHEGWDPLSQSRGAAARLSLIAANGGYCPVVGGLLTAGASRCGARALECGSVVVEHEPSHTRDWTHVPCTGRWIPSHWTTGEILCFIFESWKNMSAIKTIYVHII